jgi:hypothetical protein
MNRNVLKSIGAVLAGLVAIVVLSNGTDTVLEATGVFPPLAEQRDNGLTTWWMVLLALTYRVVYMVVGGYATATLAPHKPLRHAAVLGMIGVVVGILGAVAARGITPAWFSILLVLLGLPSVWLGGKLRTSMRVRQSPYSAHGIYTTGE